MDQEQQARNDVAFRQANEHIRSAVDAVTVDLERLPVICECADTTCTAIIRVPREEYADVRENPRRFVTLPEHCEPDAGVIVERREGYVVLEKTGVAGEVVERLAEGEAS